MTYVFLLAPFFNIYTNLQMSKVLRTLSTTTCQVTSRTTFTESDVLDVPELQVPLFPFSLKVTPSWVVTCVRSCVRPTKLFPQNCKDLTEDLTVHISDTVAEEVVVVEAVVDTVVEVAVAAVKLVLTLNQWVTVVFKSQVLFKFLYNIY